MQSIEPEKLNIAMALDLATAKELDYAIPNYRANERNIDGKKKFKTYNKSLKKNQVTQMSQIADAIANDSHHTEFKATMKKIDAFIKIASILMLGSSLPFIITDIIIKPTAATKLVWFYVIVTTIVILLTAILTAITWQKYLARKKVDQLIEMYNLIDESNLIDGLIDIPNSKYITYGSILLSSWNSIRIQLLLRDLLLLNEVDNINNSIIHNLSKTLNELYNTIDTISNSKVAIKSKILGQELPQTYNAAIDKLYEKHDINELIKVLHQITIQITTEPNQDIRTTMIHNFNTENDNIKNLLISLYTTFNNINTTLLEQLAVVRFNRKHRKTQKFDELIKHIEYSKTTGTKNEQLE